MTDKKKNQKEKDQKEKLEAAQKTIRKSVDRWPTDFVARREVKKFTGGLYSPGYLANCDSQGTGPAGAFKIGKQKCYPVYSFCEWMIKRLTVKG